MKSPREKSSREPENGQRWQPAPRTPPLLSPLPGASQQTEARDSPSLEMFSEDVGKGEKVGHPPAAGLRAAESQRQEQGKIWSPPASTTSLTEWGTKSQSARDDDNCAGWRQSLDPQALPYSDSTTGRRSLSWALRKSYLQTTLKVCVIQHQGHHSHHEAKVFWRPWDLTKSREEGRSPSAERLSPSLRCSAASLVSWESEMKHCSSGREKLFCSRLRDVEAGCGNLRTASLLRNLSQWLKQDSEAAVPPL